MKLFDFSFSTTAHSALIQEKKNQKKKKLQSVQLSEHPPFVAEAKPSSAFKFVRELNMTG